MMTKVTFVNFFINTYSILSIQYMYKISCKIHKNFQHVFSPQAYWPHPTHLPQAMRFSKKHSPSRLKRIELIIKKKLLIVPWFGVRSCSHGFEIDGKCKKSFKETSNHKMFWLDRQHSYFALEQGRKGTIQTVFQQQSWKDLRKEICFLAIRAHHRKLHQCW